MVQKRILIALVCVFDFFVFMAVVAGSALILFHIALLAVPLWAIVWTLFIFDIIWLITLKYNLKKRIIWSAISGFYTYFLVAMILSAAMLKDKTNQGALIFIIVNCVIAVLLSIYVVLSAIKLVKFLISKVKSFF